MLGIQRFYKRKHCLWEASPALSSFLLRTGEQDELCEIMESTEATSLDVERENCQDKPHDGSRVVTGLPRASGRSILKRCRVRRAAALQAKLQLKKRVEHDKYTNSWSADLFPRALGQRFL